METTSESAGFLLISSRGFMLLVQQYGKTWSVPKGHIEADESPLDCAYRELEEETGIKKEDVMLLKQQHYYERDSIGGKPERKGIYLYCGVYVGCGGKLHGKWTMADWADEPKGGDLITNDPNITDIKWVQIDHMTNPLSSCNNPESTWQKLGAWLVQEDTDAIVTLISKVVQGIVPPWLSWAVNSRYCPQCPKDGPVQTDFPSNHVSWRKDDCST